MNHRAARRLAIQRAERVKGATYPNPPVGAVILDRGGEIAGVGGTEPAGGPNAVATSYRASSASLLDAPPLG